MRVLVLPSFYPDEFNPNLGSFFKEQVSTLAKFGIQADVIYVERKSLREIGFLKFKKSHFQFCITSAPNSKEYRIKGWNIPGKIGKLIWLYWSKKIFDKYISDNGNPDIIHAHNIFGGGVLAYELNKKFKIPFIITEHDSKFLIKGLSSWEKKLARQIYPKASKIIAVSENLRTAILKYVPNIKITVIPNIVDTDFFKPDPLKMQNNCVIKFLAIGYLNKNKGHELLIDGFYELLKIDQRVVLEICGDGIEKKNLIEKIRKLNLSDRITLSGHLDKQQILTKLQEADCLIHTSYFETFGVVLIEAMSCGVPFISTKCGGPEDIYDEKVGYLINTRDIKDLKNAMLEFIQQKSKFSKLEIRSIALNKYSRKAVFEKLLNLYTEVSSDKSR